MYSVVLMAALTAGGTQAPAWGGGFCGCQGSYWTSCYGGYGSGWGSCYGGCFSQWGSYYKSCYGAYGGAWDGSYGGYGSYGGGYGGMAYPGSTSVETAPATMSATGTETRPDLTTSARLVVTLPTEAQLYIDDQLTKTPSGRRTFTTPGLQPGQAYYYMVRAQLVRDGKTFEETKRVILRPGDEVTVSFPDLGKQDTARADAGRR
jgi:uncharacterized protein (TIGR03000 family)